MVDYEDLWRQEDGRKSGMSLDHLNSKDRVCKGTSDGVFMIETGFKSMLEPHVIAQGVRDGGEEKEGKVNPCEEHVGSLQHRRREGERRDTSKRTGWGGGIKRVLQAALLGYEALCFFIVSYFTGFF